MVAAGHVLAGPAVHAGVGFALVVVDVTVGATPAGVTGAFVADAKGGDVRFLASYAWGTSRSSNSVKRLTELTR